MTRRKGTHVNRFASPFCLGDIWPRLGANLSALATRGITVPFPDALIATVAIDNYVEVRHHDAHFPLMQTALPRLRLFVEPP